MAYATEIASGATVLDVADKELMALRTSGNANNALVVNSNGDGYATYNLAGKLDIAQSSENVGKALVVGADGNVAVSALKTINNNSIVGEGNIQGGHTWTTTTPSSGTGGASSSTPAVVVENYRNGTSWYRVWSDGWIEQGGRIRYNSYWVDTQITLLKPYSDANYDIKTTEYCSYGSQGVGQQRSWRPGDNKTVFLGNITTNYFTVALGYEQEEIVLWKTCGY